MGERKSEKSRLVEKWINKTEIERQTDGPLEKD